MKNTIKITTAIFLFTFAFLTQMDAQSKQSSFNISIDFDGKMDLSIGDNFEIKLYNGLTKELMKDGLIRSDDDFSFEIDNDKVFVDGKRLRGRNLNKYQDIAREDLGDPRHFHLVWKEGNLTKLKIKTDE